MHDARHLNAKTRGFQANARDRPGTPSCAPGPLLAAAVVAAAMAAPIPCARAAGEDTHRAIRPTDGGVRVTIGEGLTVILPERVAARADALTTTAGPDLRRRTRDLLRRSAANDPAMAEALGRYLAERAPDRARTIRRTVRSFTSTDGTRQRRRATATAPAPRKQQPDLGAQNGQPSEIASGAVADAGSGSTGGGVRISGGAVGGRAPAPQQTLLSSPGVTIQAPPSRVASPTRP
jgi:hypothetical protein